MAVTQSKALYLELSGRDVSRPKQFEQAKIDRCCSHRIKPKVTWDLIKPHVFQLVQSFAFPLICLSEEEVEQFSEDPQEFARTHFGGTN